MKTEFQTIDDYVRYELKWYRRLWRKIRPSETLTMKDVMEAVKALEANGRD